MNKRIEFTVYFRDGTVEVFENNVYPTVEPTGRMKFDNVGGDVSRQINFNSVNYIDARYIDA
jgi:hypothetical protein